MLRNLLQKFVNWLSMEYGIRADDCSPVTSGFMHTSLSTGGMLPRQNWGVPVTEEMLRDSQVRPRATATEVMAALQPSFSQRYGYASAQVQANPASLESITTTHSYQESLMELLRRHSGIQEVPNFEDTPRDEVQVRPLP